MCSYIDTVGPYAQAVVSDGVTVAARGPDESPVDITLDFPKTAYFGLIFPWTYVANPRYQNLQF